MAQLPFVANCTFQIVHNGGGGPAGIPGFLQGNYGAHAEHGEKDPANFRYTHTLLCPIGTDIRDEYDAGIQPGGQDTVYIPSGAGAAATPWTVRFVETKAWNTPWVHIKVYLDRGTPPWPTTTL
jgi:hypothetical protein